MPSDFNHELEERLSGRKFRFYAVLSLTGVYEAVLKVEPDGVLQDAFIPSPLPISSRFDVVRSRAWSLPCCLETVRWNVSVWLACFQEKNDRMFWGDEDVLRTLEVETNV